MKEQKCLITIKNNEKENTLETKVIIDENKKEIYYVENDREHTFCVFDYKNNIIKRDNENIYLEYQFIEGKTTDNSILMKSLGSKIDIEVYTEKIINNNKQIKITYKIDEDKFTYKIDYLDE